MEKIPFQDGTKITNAKVTIDGVDYTITPATYSGTTPLSASNLNQMQDNIEDAINSIVSVSDKIAVLSGILKRSSETVTSKQLGIDYPTGFSFNNTVVLSSVIYAYYGTNFWDKYWGTLSTESYSVNIAPYRTNSILLDGRSLNSEYQYNYQIVIMRTD